MKIEDEIKSNFANEHQKAMVNLLYTNYHIGSKMKSHFKQFDITTQQFNILRILRGQYPKPASIGLLKDRMLDKNSDVSRIIDRLVIKEWIKRTECKADRRQKDIVISKAGMKLLEDIDNIDGDREDVLSNLSVEEAERFNYLLDKIRG